MLGDSGTESALRSTHRDDFGAGAAPGVLQPPPRFPRAGHRPGLGRAAARQMRGIALVNLADMAETGIGEMVADRFQPALCRRRVAMHPVMRHRPGAEQPCPDWPLMVGAVAVDPGAAIAAPVFRGPR